MSGTMVVRSERERISKLLQNPLYDNLHKDEFYMNYNNILHKRFMALSAVLNAICNSNELTYKTGDYLVTVFK